MRPFLLPVLALLLPLSWDSTAESLIERGDVEVHYNALPSTSLAPEVARQFAITRSANRGLLNVSVLRRQGDGTRQAITARIEAAATNLNGQRQELAVREVREGEAIYYLAEPRVSEGETLNFELQVQPEGEDSAIQVRFQQQFFAAR